MKTHNPTLTLSMGLLFLGITANAQNMVANADMKPVDDAPCTPARIDKASGYSNANGGTVDYFSKDSRSSDVKIPKNFVGEQDAASNYAGIIAYYAPDQTDWDAVFAGDLSFPEKKQEYMYSEYMQVELSSPLVAGKVYNVSVNVSLADQSAYASGLGAYLSSNKVEQRSNEEMALTPTVTFPGMVSDKAGWKTLSGSFTAAGGEKYLVIGRFAGQGAQKVIGENENDNRRAYYYLNSPSVTPGAGNTGRPIVIINFDDLLDGKALCLPNLNFELNSATILPESYDELNTLASWMKNHPELSLQIDGHTDKTGNDEINMPLSKERAAAVKSYLSGKGVKTDNIHTNGYGSSRPIDTDNVASLTNRRVEICIKK